MHKKKASHTVASVLYTIAVECRLNDECAQTDRGISLRVICFIQISQHPPIVLLFT